MDDISSLRLVPASSATVPIDWSKVPEASKEFFLRGWDADWEPMKERPLPATIGELADMLNESQFFGYMEQQRCTLVLDISEFGLTQSDTNIPGPALGSLPVGPHFYMKYLDQVWFVLFVPGKRDGILGVSPKIPHAYSEPEGDYDEDEQIARDKKVVEDYEPKLCNEISRWGTIGAISNKKIAGWESVTMQNTLEEAQMYNAVMTLPRGHPARRDMMEGFMASLRQWEVRYSCGGIIFWTYCSSSFMYSDLWIRIFVFLYDHLALHPREVGSKFGAGVEECRMVVEIPVSSSNLRLDEIIPILPSLKEKLTHLYQENYVAVIRIENQIDSFKIWLIHTRS